MKTKKDKEIKKLVNEANQTCFITCTELAKHKVTVYVTEKAVMIRDNVDMKNSYLVPFDELISKRSNDNDTESSTAENTDTANDTEFRG